MFSCIKCSITCLRDLQLLHFLYYLAEKLEKASEKEVPALQEKKTTAESKMQRKLIKLVFV